MPFVKGQSGNPAGRPRYSAVDAINAEQKRRKKFLVQEIFECIDAIPEESKSDRLPHLFKLMDFLYSKPKETEVSLEQAIEIVKQAVEYNKKSTGASEQSIRRLPDDEYSQI